MAENPPQSFSAVTPPNGEAEVKLRLPPRTSTKTPPKRESTATQRFTAARIKTRLTEWLNLAAAGITMRDPFDGLVIGMNADKLAEAYAPLIERDKRLQQLFAQLEKGGAYGAAITVTIGVAIPILVHHGKLPDTLVPLARLSGVNIPDIVPVVTHPVPNMTPDASPENILA